MDTKTYGKLANAIVEMDKCLKAGCTIKNIEANINKQGCFNIPIETSYNQVEVINGLKNVKAHFESTVQETPDEETDKKVTTALELINQRFGITNADTLIDCVKHLIENEDNIDKVAAMVNKDWPNSIQNNNALFDYFIDLMINVQTIINTKDSLFQNFQVLQHENAALKARVKSLEIQNQILSN